MSDFDLTGIGMTSQRTRDRLVDRLREQGIACEDVLQTVRSIPRHIFVDEALAHRAYEDTSLPIGSGQTISQPYVVALMTESIHEKHPEKVLEIGTGCGYQTAVLAHMYPQVFSVERIEALQTRARKRLAALGCSNIRYRIGDGYAGWESYAPYDAIIVTAGAASIPHALVSQLAEGGRLIVPVGDSDTQTLQVVDRQNGELVVNNQADVRFVPLLKGTA